MLRQHSKRASPFLIGLLLAAVAAVSATYVEPSFYGDASYYYYPSPEPTGYYPSPEPAAYYYVQPPAVYGSPAPVPYYYYTAPPPVNPTVPSPPPPSPPSPAPYYYYTSPPTSYGYPPVPPTYYYYAQPPVSPPPPVNPTFPSPAPPPSYYYYTIPAPPAPYGYTPSPPAYYYYTAPTPAPTPTPYYTPAPTPSVCPPCPTCDTSSETPTAANDTSSTTYMTIAGSSSEGTCYCAYDNDWRRWAISSTSCRSTLYSKCDKDSRLSCEWLDTYFAPNATSAHDYTRANEDKIEGYLYNDCPPAAPCACSSMNFDGKDSGSETFQCCQALKVYAKVPFSGLASKDVDAFCESSSIKAGARVAGWARAKLWHVDCSTSSGSVYTFKAPSTETTSASSAAAASAPKEAKSASGDKSEQRTKIIAGTVGAVGGAALAVAAAAGYMAYRKNNPAYRGMV